MFCCYFLEILMALEVFITWFRSQVYGVLTYRPSLQDQTNLNIVVNARGGGGGGYSGNFWVGMCRWDSETLYYTMFNYILPSYSRLQ